MTHVVFYKSGNTFWGFDVEGHSGFADAGEDIVCAAISSMTMLVVNAVETAYASNVDYTIDDETAKVCVRIQGALPEYESDEKKRYAISGLVMAYYYQLNDMLEEYYDFIDVDVIEKKFEGNK